MPSEPTLNQLLTTVARTSDHINCATPCMLPMLEAKVDTLARSFRNVSVVRGWVMELRQQILLRHCEHLAMYPTEEDSNHQSMN